MTQGSQGGTLEQAKEKTLLQGLCALDLSDEKGSICGLVLADLGVDVIKVEPVGGDPARSIGPFFHDEPHPEKSLSWFARNANKRSVTLDLQHRVGRRLFTRLVEKADFVIESFPPDHMKRLGLDYATLQALNLRIIMTSITPFGQEGPYRLYEGSDLVVAAMGGWVFVCGDADRPPVRFSIDQAYIQAGMQAAVGTLLAHCYRERTGIGQQVDVSAQEAILWTVPYPAYFWHAAEQLFSRNSFYQKRLNVTYRRMYPCKDGYVSYMVGVGNVAGPMHERLVRIMDKEGKAGVMKDKDFTSLGLDTVSQADLDRWEETLVQYFSTKTKSELQALAIENGLFVCPVNTLKESYEYPQLASRGYWKPVRHDELGVTLRYPGFLFIADGFSPGILRRAPLIGEHNKDIYIGELGFSEKDLAAWKKDGAI